MKLGLGLSIPGLGSQRQGTAAKAYARAVFALDARLNPSTGVPTDLSANALSVQNGSTSGSDANDVLFLPAPSTLGVTRYVYLPGLTGNFLSAPDEAALDITGDLDLRAHVAPTDWTPSLTPTILGKWAGAPNNSYGLAVNTDGTLRLYISTNGTDGPTVSSSVAVPFTDGAAGWVRATRASTSGQVRFFTSTDGVAWSQLGTDQTLSAGSAISAGTAALRLGDANVANHWIGSIIRAQVRSGIDGPVVFDWSASDPVNSTHTSFTASTGQTVTVNRATSGRKTAVVEAAKWLLGTDDYIEVADNALLDFGAADSFTVLAVYRRFGTQASYVGVLSKSTDITNPALPGYAIRGGATTIRLAVTDGSVGSTVYTAAQTDVLGDINVFAGVQTAANARYGWLDGAVSATETTSLGSFANASALWIGKSGAGSNFDGELYAVYIWREALTASELAAIAADWGAA